MRKLIAIGTAAALFLPAFVMAAADDVSLTTDVQLSVNGITINVSGSTATVESITVDTSTFSFVLADGSAITMVTPGREKLNPDTETYATNVCTSAESKLSYTATGALTVTVSPTSALCNANVSGGGGGSTSGGGGGGGATPAKHATSATTESTTTT